MSTYDIIMVAVLVAATVFGASKGLAWQVASLGSIFFSYFVALHFREAVGSLIHASPPWNNVLGMLVVYVATSLAIWLAFGFVSGFIDRLRLKEFDHQVGALLGLATGLSLCLLITFFAVGLAGDEMRASICQSRSGQYIARILDKADALLPSEVQDVVKPYLRSLDEKLEQPSLEQPPAEQASASASAG